MAKNKQDSPGKILRERVSDFLDNAKPRLTTRLASYICLTLKRPDLFARDAPHLFRSSAFRGIKIAERDYERTINFLNKFNLSGNYSDTSVIRRNLRNRAYMKKAADFIESDILRNEIGHPYGFDDLLRGQYLLDRFRRLVGRAPILRVRDIERRLHVDRKVAEVLIKHDADPIIGRVRIVHHMTGPDWIIRNGRWAR